MDKINIFNKVFIILILGVIIVMNTFAQINNSPINAEELMNEFLQNETNFIKKYTDKKITITGKIFGKGTPKDDIPEKDFNYIVIGNFEETGVCVFFYFNEFINWNVKEGEIITVEGNFREIKYIKDFYSGEIVFKNIIIGECKIKK
jgi:hypothetical protein